MKLNTKIKSIDLISSKDKIQFDNEGTFPINFGNNFIDENEQIKFQSEIELIEDRLSFSIDVNFRYQSNCGRCLTASNNEDRSSFSTTLNIKEDNDYEINYDDERLIIKCFEDIDMEDDNEIKQSYEKSSQVQTWWQKIYAKLKRS